MANPFAHLIPYYWAPMLPVVLLPLAFGGAAFCSRYFPPWSQLIAQFSLEGSPPERILRFKSAKIGWMNYSSCLNFGLDDRGLYMAGSAFFRVSNPAVLIPWNRIRAESQRRLYSPVWTLTVDEADLKIQIADSLYREIDPFLKSAPKR